MDKTKIAIIQLTRIGDIIQTTQAARQMKAESPDAHLTLIARRKFAKGLMFLLETVFDNIILFDTADFFIQKNLNSGKAEVSSFIKQLKSEKFEFTINLSFSKSSSYLAQLIDSPYKLGLHRNENNQIVLNDRWSQYIYSNVLNNTHVPFSLVDMYRFIMGVKENHVLDDDDNFAKRDNNIVIHPFASQKKKKWGVNKWAEVIYKLLNDFKDHTIHIVGGQEDATDALRLIHSPSLSKLQDRIKVHAGQYTIADTYKLLMNSKLFLGHDSMVGHLASETLTPSITLSLGTVRPHETTPFSKKAISIAPTNKCFPCNIEKNCDLLPCHNSINTQLVSFMAHEFINNGEITREAIKNKLTPLHLANVKVYKASYETYGLNLVDISGNYQSLDDSFRAFYKVIWLYYLNETEINTNLPDISQQTAKELHNYLNGSNYLFELYNFGVNYSNRILNEAKKKNSDLKEIQTLVNKLSEIDSLCSITKRTFPLLKGLVDYFYVNKANVIGDTLVTISEQNILNYYDASNLVAVVNDFLQKTTAPFVAPNNLSKEA